MNYVINPSLLEEVGGDLHYAAVFSVYFQEWQGSGEPIGGVCLDHTTVEEHTGAAHAKQRSARVRLVVQGLVTTRRAGFPGRVFVTPTIKGYDLMEKR